MTIEQALQAMEAAQKIRSEKIANFAADLGISKDLKFSLNSYLCFPDCDASHQLCELVGVKNLKSPEITALTEKGFNVIIKKGETKC